MRVAIYARVSADDKGQDPENQLRELRDWVINSGHVISREYVDYESGRKGAEKRKQFAALFDDAAKRKFDCVLFWALDRFSREGMTQTIFISSGCHPTASHFIAIPSRIWRPTTNWSVTSCSRSYRRWLRSRRKR